MWTEQAIFTSLPRRGRGGYHLVSQSRGVGAADGRALARWAPSHGALIVDANNRASVNFHPLPSGRFALSRTCAGPPEYSGRGGRQLYTHILIIEDAVVQAPGFNPVTVYRAAAALGCFLYQSQPSEILEPAKLSELRPARDAAAWGERAVSLGLPPLDPLQRRLRSGRPHCFAYPGARVDLVECLLGSSSPREVAGASFSTSLVPSSERPFTLALVNETPK